MALSNSQLILALAAGAIVIGGVVAVKNLTGPEKSDKVSITEKDTASDSSGDDNYSDPSPRVTGINSSDNKSPRSTSDKSFNRGKTGASIDVTPATTAPMAMADHNAATSVTITGDSNKNIADLANHFTSESDPEVRVDIADELGLIDEPESIRKILELLKNETDPTVQAALLEAMQGLDALEQTAPEVLAAIRDIYDKSTDPDVRTAAQDLLGDIDSPDSVAMLRDQRNNPQASAQERLNAAENLMRIRASEPDLIPDDEVAAIGEQLKTDYQGGEDAAVRSQAVMALAIDGKKNLPFFQQALQTEQDPQLKQLLERLVRMFTAAPPATPPPGTVITPAPTPPVN